MYNYGCKPSCPTTCQPTCQPVCNCQNSCEVECEKYKKQADELYAQAACLKDQANAAFAESNMILMEAKALEDKLKELVQLANCKCQEGNQAQQQANYLLDLASNASQEANDCFKKCNQNQSCTYHTLDVIEVKCPPVSCVPNNNCNTMPCPPMPPNGGCGCGSRY